MNAPDLSNLIAGLSLLTSLITLWLAYKIYDRFGVTSTFKAKEQQLVIDFVGDLFGFKLGLLGGNVSMSSSFSSDAVELYKRNLILNEHKGWQVYLSKDLYEKFVALGNLTNHPYFPDELKEKCMLLNQNYRTVASNQRDQNSFMFFCGEIHFEWDEILYCQAHNSTPFNVETFLNDLKEILLSIESYYKKNLPNHIPQRLMYRYWN
ncbi:hypothetical protein [Pedobacter kyonggii]|uniref:Uncharacterized protein n=1 Tax=Pedobacter kyonggii TaxID=1926871 RepID=A0A4Q9H5J6_9SPHI|nr:hypothetical protein [Pedobacter kyonggii]TBO35941.1 hypothetical protein EYS08_25375 [Pedobacter kyonggii]